MIYFVYTLKADNQSVELLDYCNKESDIPVLLVKTAKKFIAHEDGQRRAEAPFYENESAPETDGHFLRKNGDHQIDVYRRTTELIPGTIWNSFNITCEKIMHFGVTSTDMDFSSLRIVTALPSERTSSHQDAHLAELKTRLQSQLQKVNSQIEKQYEDASEEEVSDSDYESD